MQPIYLDYNASTPIAREVREAMLPYLEAHYGNPSSRHWAGAPAKAALQTAREQVAALLGAQADEIVFTGGGTEANNAAIKGAYFAAKKPGAHLITTAVEHPATLNPCRFLETLGARLTVLPVDSTGRVDPDAVAKAITPQTVLISVMHANNEVGTLQPIAEIARIAKSCGVLLHTDAAQSMGKVPARVDELGVDLLSIAGHKLYAPKGVGVLYVRSGVQLEPHMHGAGHESGRRAGTENVLLNVGLGKACELAGKWLPQADAMRELRERFWLGLHELFGEKVVLNGHLTQRLPNTLNVSFVEHIGAELLGKLDGVAASTGSACHEGQVALSPVLKAMGVLPDEGKGAVRFSLGRYTTADDIDRVLNMLRHMDD